MQSTGTIFGDDCALMLHCDGTNGSTNVIDETGKTVTVNGAAAIDTSQSKFGGASLRVGSTGTSDDIQIADHPDFDVGTGDFTIDYWIRISASEGGQWTMVERSWESNGFLILRREGKIQIFMNNSLMFEGSAWSPSANTWYHIEISRASGTLRVFIDGTKTGSDTASAQSLNNSGALVIGGRASGGANVNGWFDEFRFTVGTAVHTADFIPPIAAYTPPLSGNFFLMF